MADWGGKSAERGAGPHGWTAKLKLTFTSLRWLGLSATTGIVLACGALGTRPTLTPTPDAPALPGRAWATFIRQDCEWSDSRRSAECFGDRGAGFQVRAVRPEGNRWYVWDPTTDNYAYVDRDALSLPAELTAEQARTRPASKEAVICLDRSNNFRYLAQAQQALGTWIREAARPTDTFYLRWIEENSYRPEAEIVAAIHLPPEPTPIPVPPTPGPPNPFSTAQVSAATATVAAIQTVASADVATRQAFADASRQTLAKQVDAFAAAQPARAESGDVSGCVKKASELLAGFGGDRDLLIAYADNEGAPQLPGVRLDRVQINVIYLQCDQPAHCDAIKQQWRELAAAANAADVEFSDPTEALSKVGT